MEAGTGHHELLMCLPCQYVVAASRTKETSLQHIKAAQDQSFPLFTRKPRSLLLHTNQLSLSPNNIKLPRPKNKENNFLFATRRAAANSRFYRS